MSHVEIRKALEEHIYGMTQAPEFAWENMPFSPTIGVPYIKLRFAPLTSPKAAIGVDSAIKHRGLFFIDLRFPENQGPNAADEIADLLLTLFKPGTVLQSGSVRVTILYTDRHEGLSLPPWYQVPITITWYSYI